jgi:hypothetical protein
MQPDTASRLIIHQPIRMRADIVALLSHACAQFRPIHISNPICANIERPTRRHQIWDSGIPLPKSSPTMSDTEPTWQWNAVRGEEFRLSSDKKHRIYRLTGERVRLIGEHEDEPSSLSQMNTAVRVEPK